MQSPLSSLLPTTQPEFTSPKHRRQAVTALKPSPTPHTHPLDTAQQTNEARANLHLRPCALPNPLAHRRARSGSGSPLGDGSTHVGGSGWVGSLHHPEKRDGGVGASKERARSPAYLEKRHIDGGRKRTWQMYTGYWHRQVPSIFLHIAGADVSGDSSPVPGLIVGLAMACFTRHAQVKISGSY